MSELQYLWQVTVAGLGTGLLYGLVGIGFAIVYNVSGIINLAQGEFSMLGAMLTLFAIKRLELPIVLAALLAVVVVTLLGVAFERTCISRLRPFSMQAAIIITLGASIFARGGAMVAWGKDNHSLPAFSGQGSAMVLGAAVPLQTLWIMGVAAIAIVTPPTEISANHEHHLDVAETHRFDAAKFFPRPTHEPERATAEQRADQRSRQRSHKDRHVGERALRERWHVVKMWRAG